MHCLDRKSNTGDIYRRFMISCKIENCVKCYCKIVLLITCFPFQVKEEVDKLLALKEQLKQLGEEAPKKFVLKTPKVNNWTIICLQNVYN